MSNEATNAVIEQMVSALLSDNPDYFLVEIKILPPNNIKVFLDADGGVSIDKCVRYNRALYKQIEESGMFPTGDFSLEVSSPGIGEPLKQHRQYVKNKGRDVEVITTDDRKLTGKMLEVTEEAITLETLEGKGKKQEVKTEDILFSNIKQTKVQIKF